MVALPEGIGPFVWQPDLVANGNIEEFASMVASARFGHFIFKLANDVHVYPYTPEKQALAAAQIQIAKASGAKVYGYGYIYGIDPVGEANIAISQIDALDLDGWYVDAEGEMKTKKAAAASFMARLRSVKGDFPIALCSYRYPTYHETFPWEEFLSTVSFVAPQVYWEGATNALEQLKRSQAEYQQRAPHLPFVPVGSGYSRGTWTPTPAQWLEVLDYSKQRFSGISFWEWAKTYNGVRAVWDLLTSYPWAVTPPPPPPPQDSDHEVMKTYLVNIAAFLETLRQDHTATDRKVDMILELVRNGGGTPPPPPPGQNTATYRVTQDKAIAYFVRKPNAKDKPIMEQVPVAERTKQPWKNVNGETVTVIRQRVDADGTIDFWPIAGVTREANPTDDKQVYLSAADGKLID